MSGARRLVIGEIDKNLKGEEYLKAVDKMANAGAEGSKEEEASEKE